MEAPPALSILNGPVVSTIIPRVPASISIPLPVPEAFNLIAAASSSVEVILTDEPVAVISISSPAAAPLAEISIPPAEAVICKASAPVPVDDITRLESVLPVSEKVKSCAASVVALVIPVPLRGKGVISKSPVESAVAAVVPNTKASAVSSHPINALLPVVPLSIIIPDWCSFAPSKPLCNSIILSVIVVFVVFTLLVVPSTLKSPVIVRLPPTSVFPVTSKALNLASLRISAIINKKFFYIIIIFYLQIFK